MKKAMLVLALALSASAFATEFTAKIDDVNCTIVNGVVTRTATFGKELKASWTEKKTVQMEGLAPFIEKAMAAARDIQMSEDFQYSMKHEGKTYILNVDDSRESMSLIRMISRICR